MAQQTILADTEDDKEKFVKKMKMLSSSGWDEILMMQNVFTKVGGKIF